MIKWVRIDNNENIIDKENVEDNEIPYIIEIIKNQLDFSKENLLIMYRQNKFENEKIYAWGPSQRIVLYKNELMIIDSDKTTIDNDIKIWNSLNKYFKNEKDYHNIFQEYIGYYGYISYDIINILSDDVNNDAEFRFPLMILDFPTKFVIETDKNKLYIDINENIIKKNKLKIKKPKTKLNENTVFHHTEFNEYMTALKQIKHHILEGNIYQANYTQKFTFYKEDNLDVIQLFDNITKKYKLTNSAYFNFDEFQIFSLSPELLLKIEKNKIYTKPIKGTRPRGNSKIKDYEMIKELSNSEKENSELSMIVDLIRNEMNKTAITDSVKVSEHAKIETYENVHHLVSLIEAKIEMNFKSSWRFLLRFIPGGSISGVPKNRAVNLLYDIEKYPREIYTGNLGFIGLNGNLQMNIAIRTAIIIKNEIILNSGGGIVMDSEDIEEYVESLNKLKHIMKYFGKSFIGHLSILNDKIIESEKIEFEKIKNGFFESILLDKGEIKNKHYHELRIQNGIKWLTMKYRNISIKIDQVEKLIKLNLADNDKVKLNIYFWKSNDNFEINTLYQLKQLSEMNNMHKLFLNTYHIDPPAEIKKIGIKSLNYDQYSNSTKIAENFNCWDSINYDIDNNILEGGKSTLYFYKDNKWITPKNNVVNGVIRGKLLNDRKVYVGNVKIDELNDIKAIAISNSIIGIKEIYEIYSNKGIIWKSSNFNLFKSIIP